VPSTELNQGIGAESGRGLSEATLPEIFVNVVYLDALESVLLIQAYCLPKSIRGEGIEGQFRERES
jgi:hypothetical protein